jgi:hypothetical protein
VTATTSSTSQKSGALVVAGGIGAGGDIYAQNITLTSLSGTGNAFACLDSTGKLYRSNVSCV